MKKQKRLDELIVELKINENEKALFENEKEEKDNKKTDKNPPERC